MHNRKLSFRQIRQSATTIEFGKQNKGRILKRIYPQIAGNLLFLLMILFWGKAIFLVKTQTDNLGHNSVEIILDGDKIGKAEEKEIIKNEQEQDNPAEFILWGQQRNISLENVEYDRSTTAPVLFLAGDSDKILDSVDGQLKGNSIKLKEEDTEGCLLGYETASELFGTENAVGNSFFYAKRKLTVRGVFSNIKKSIVLQATSEDMQSQNLLDHIFLYIPKGESQNQYVDNFLLRNGLTGEVVGKNFITGVEKFLTFLPLSLLFLFFIKRYHFIIKKYEHFPIIKGILLFILAGAALCFFWTIKKQIQIPPDIIPTRWSDFSFWSKYFTMQKNSLFVLFTTEKTPFQIEDLKRLGKVMENIVIVLFCLWKKLYILSAHSRSGTKRPV